MLLPSALVSSTCLPVSVCGTGPVTAIAAFLGGLSGLFATLLRSASHASLPPGGFPPGRASCLRPVPYRARPSFPRPRSSVSPEHRILHLSSIAYASPPRLRSRLSQGRSALPWNPRTSGPDDSHIRLATHSGILPRMHSTTPSGMASASMRCSPTSPAHTSVRAHSAASAACLAPCIFGAGPLG